ncbi:MAG: DUF542 domain-containing protein [Holophagales bacterium]|nr:DUF542 domain-containing protein [Holophagales bacterium]
MTSPSHSATTTSPTELPADLTLARVADLARLRPGTIRVFQRHAIDFCCGGGKSLAEAASRAGVALAPPGRRDPGVHRRIGWRRSLHLLRSPRIVARSAAGLARRPRQADRRPVPRRLARRAAAAREDGGPGRGRAWRCDAGGAAAAHGDDTRPGRRSRRSHARGGSVGVSGHRAPGAGGRAL